MRTDRESLIECVRTGLFVATGLTAIAAAVVVIGTIINVVQNGVHPAARSVGSLPVAALAVVGSYYLAGVLGGSAYYWLQRVQDYYLGQMLIAFVLGGIAYGTMGMSLTLAYVLADVNLLNLESHAQAWRALAILTPILAALTAILGPPILRSR